MKRKMMIIFFPGGRIRSLYYAGESFRIESSMRSVEEKEDQFFLQEFFWGGGDDLRPDESLP